MEEGKILLGIHGKARSGKNTVTDMMLDHPAIGHEFLLYSFADPLKDCVNEMFGWDDRHREGELKEEIVDVEVTFEDMLNAIGDHLGPFWVEELERDVFDSLTVTHNGNKEFVYDKMVTTFATEYARKWLVYVLAKHGTVNIPVDEEDYIINESSQLFSIRLSPRQAYQWFGTDFGRDMIHSDIWMIMARRAREQAKRENYRGVIIPDVRFENEASFIRDYGGAMIHVRNNRVDSGAVHAHASENGVEIHENDVIIENHWTLENLEHEVSDKIGSLFKINQ